MRSFISPDWRSSKRIAKLNLYVRRIGKKVHYFTYFDDYIFTGLPGALAPSFLQIRWPYSNQGYRLCSPRYYWPSIFLDLPPPLHYISAVPKHWALIPPDNAMCKAFLKFLWPIRLQDFSIYSEEVGLTGFNIANIYFRYYHLADCSISRKFYETYLEVFKSLRWIISIPWWLVLELTPS